MYTSLEPLSARSSISSFSLCVYLDLVGAIIVVFVMAILYEGLKTLREYLLFLDVKRTRKPSKAAGAPDSDRSQLILTEQAPIGSGSSKGLVVGRPRIQCST